MSNGGRGDGGWETVRTPRRPSFLYRLDHHHSHLGQGPRYRLGPTENGRITQRSLVWDGVGIYSYVHCRFLNPFSFLVTENWDSLGLRTSLLLNDQTDNLLSVIPWKVGSSSSCRATLRSLTQ